MNIYNTRLTIFITMVATIGGFLFGFDSGVINGTVDGLQAAFNSDTVGTGFNVASMLLGCAVGAFLAGTLADRFGRRGVLLLSALFFTASAWGSGISLTSLEFVCYRILGGLAVGAASVLAPAYISEIAPAKYRGRLSSIQQIAIISGLFCSFLSNYVLAQIAGNTQNILAWGYEAWRWMFWVELIPAVTFLFALILIPESPRYLVASGQKAKALAVLELLTGDSAKDTCNSIERTLSGNSNHSSFKDIIGPIGFKPIIWIGLTLAAFQQFVGINVVFYYGSVLWQSAGFGESDALLINVISGAVSIGACIAALLSIDRIGRKLMLLIGSAGMTLTLGLLAYSFTQASIHQSGDLQLVGVWGPIALVAANLYVVCFNFSWGPVVWVLLGEMFPNQFRGTALAISGLSMWAANFAITITFPMLLKEFGLSGAYILYASCAFFSFFIVWKFVRETKGIELEAMVG